MNEIQANIFDIYKDYDAICCTTNSVVKTNGELVMGAGIAKAFSNKYPWLSKLWGQQVRKFSGKYNILVTLMKSNPHLIYFKTKEDYKYPSNPDLIEKSLKDLKYITDIIGWQKVLLPRPGCKNGGLDWKDIKILCNKYLDDRFTIIYE